MSTTRKFTSANSRSASIDLGGFRAHGETARTLKGTQGTLCNRHPSFSKQIAEYLLAAVASGSELDKRRLLGSGAALSTTRQDDRAAALTSTGRQFLVPSPAMARLGGTSGIARFWVA